MKIRNLILVLIAFSSYADDVMLVNQYQFSQIISSYELSQVTNDINNNNITRVQIIYQANDLMTAQQIKNDIQQSANSVDIELTANNYQVATINYYQSSPITVNLYGTVGNGKSNGSNLNKKSSGDSFYGYTTQEKGFYYDNSNSDE
jgi:hypothetical protein